MNAASAFETCVVAERFEKVLKLIRAALTEMDLEIAAETERGTNCKEGLSMTLMVDCPLLIFEALALDRAAAVFFPLHVLVTATDGGTQISSVNPTKLLTGRLPIGVRNPMDRLMARVGLAMESASEHAGAISY